MPGARVTSSSPALVTGTANTGSVLPELRICESSARCVSGVM